MRWEVNTTRQSANDWGVGGQLARERPQVAPECENTPPGPALAEDYWLAQNDRNVAYDNISQYLHFMSPVIDAIFIIKVPTYASYMPFNLGNNFSAAP
jgi:hypothetical protein